MNQTTTTNLIFYFNKDVEQQKEKLFVIYAWTKIEH